MFFRGSSRHLRASPSMDPNLKCATISCALIWARSRVYEIEAATVFHCRVAGDLAEVLSGAAMDERRSDLISLAAPAAVPL